MGKQKTNHSVAKQGDNEIVQVSHEEDDNLLPSPDELRKYHALDPSIIDWIKKRCDTEQCARIEFNNEKVRIHKSVSNQLYRIDMTSIVASVIVVLAGITMSGFLIRLNQIVSGTLFGGGVIVIYAIRVLNFRKNQK